MINRTNYEILCFQRILQGLIESNWRTCNRPISLNILSQIVGLQSCQDEKVVFGRNSPLTMKLVNENDYHTKPTIVYTSPISFVFENNLSESTGCYVYFRYLSLKEKDKCSQDFVNSTYGTVRIGMISNTGLQSSELIAHDILEITCNTSMKFFLHGGDVLTHILVVLLRREFPDKQPFTIAFPRPAKGMLVQRTAYVKPVILTCEERKHLHRKNLRLKNTVKNAILNCIGM